MEFDQYQVNAFTQRQFGGNPAAIVPLEEWLPTDMMQAIAAENNLSETAFFVAEGDGFGLRWFTPEVEVELCGHATLATSHVLFHELHSDLDELRFQTRSGELVVKRDGERISMNFPATAVTEAAIDPSMAAALGGRPMAAFDSPSNIYLYESEAEVRALAPDMVALMAATSTTTIVTAAGDEVDFVSRFFGPQVGINEDPVTGSAHCALVPLWAARLGRNELSATQVSKRRGDLECELRGDRVVMKGVGQTFLRGKITLQL